VATTSLAREGVAGIDAARSTGPRGGRPTLLESRELAIAGITPAAASLQAKARCGGWRNGQPDGEETDHEDTGEDKMAHGRALLGFIFNTNVATHGPFLWRPITSSTIASMPGLCGRVTKGFSLAIVAKVKAHVPDKVVSELDFPPHLCAASVMLPGRVMSGGCAVPRIP
jgi:hypothetical protein